MMAVVDASFAGAWIMPDEQSGEADRFLLATVKGGGRILAPDLWLYEMLNLLTVAVRRKRLSEPQQAKALALLQRLPLDLHDHHQLLTQQRILRLADRFSLSAYDAAYLELADRFPCPLHTLDNALRAAAVQLGLPVR